jgi:hypothetical protein
MNGWIKVGAAEKTVLRMQERRESVMQGIDF